MSTMPTRVDGELFASAKSSGAVHSRSAAQQIDHWARIGRALESSGSTSHRDIERVLAGEASYDDLAEREQAIVRATWDEHISDGIAGLDLQVELESTSDTWVEADVDGRVVERRPDGGAHTATRA